MKTQVFSNPSSPSMEAFIYRVWVGSPACSCPEENWSNTESKCVSLPTYFLLFKLKKQEVNGSYERCEQVSLFFLLLFLNYYFIEPHHISSELSAGSLVWCSNFTILDPSWKVSGRNGQIWAARHLKAGRLVCHASVAGSMSTWSSGGHRGVVFVALVVTGEWNTGKQQTGRNSPCCWTTDSLDSHQWVLRGNGGITCRKFWLSF